MNQTLSNFYIVRVIKITGLRVRVWFPNFNFVSLRKMIPLPYGPNHLLLWNSYLSIVSLSMFVFVETQQSRVDLRIKFENNERRCGG